jgi:hypothetical protein
MNPNFADGLRREDEMRTKSLEIRASGGLSEFHAQTQTFTPQEQDPGPFPSKPVDQKVFPWTCEKRA